MSYSIINPYTASDLSQLAATTTTHSNLMVKINNMKDKRNILDNKIKELNILGDTHVSEQQLHLDTTIYVGLIWTVAASGLIYYTLTQ